MTSPDGSPDKLHKDAINWTELVNYYGVLPSDKAGMELVGLSPEQHESARKLMLRVTRNSSGDIDRTLGVFEGIIFYHRFLKDRQFADSDNVSTFTKAFRDVDVTFATHVTEAYFARIISSNLSDDEILPDTLETQYPVAEAIMELSARRFEQVIVSDEYREGLVDGAAYILTLLVEIGEAQELKHAHPELPTSE